MSLHFDLMINGHVIGHYNARRIAGGSQQDDINTYDVEFTEVGMQSRFQLTHRYGDGAWELVRKSTEQLANVREAHRAARAAVDAIV